MIRELLINVYLFLFRTLFTFFKIFPQKEKTVFMTYFGYNSLSVINAIEEIKPKENIVIGFTKHSQVKYQESENREIINFHSFKAIFFIYHLATSKRILVDNYYAFLSVTKFKPGTMCIQMWHAAGAIKKFGLRDISIEKRNPSALKRFKNVYEKFTHVACGSQQMANIFCQSFGIKTEQILFTGVPRTDIFFNEKLKLEVKRNLFIEYPYLKCKKVILYAPTFRKEANESIDKRIDINKLYDSFKDDYVFIFKDHPTFNKNFINPFPDFFIDLSTHNNINHLLLIADILITDYSSIPFEFSFLEKPMIFYSYDLDEYIKERGIWGEYKDIVPGSIAQNTDELIKLIKINNFDIKLVTEFKNKWNEYSNGNSSNNLVNYMFKKNEAN